MSGVFSPPTMRSRCCHVIRSLDTRVMMLVAEAIFPSRVTPVLFTIHWLPSAGPDPFAKPAFRVEDPGADRLGQGVPADALGTGHHRTAADLDLEFAQDIALIVGPAVGGHDQGFRAFVHPFADHPLELLELLLGRRRVVGKVSRAGRQPLAVLPGVDHRVGTALGGLIGPMGHGRHPVLDGHVRTDEANGPDGQIHVGLGMLLEDSGEDLLDPFTALSGLALFTDDLSVRQRTATRSPWHRPRCTPWQTPRRRAGSTSRPADAPGRGRTPRLPCRAWRASLPIRLFCGPWATAIATNARAIPAMVKILRMGCSLSC